MGIVILLTIIHRHFKSDKYSSKAYYYIWLLIALRLIVFIDFSLEFKYQLKGPDLIERVFIREDTTINNPSQQTERLNTNNKVVKTPSSLFRIWLLGFLSYTGFQLSSYIIFKKRLLDSLEAVDQESLYKFNRLKTSLGIDRNIAISKSDLIQSPMVVSILKPRLVLPNSIQKTKLNYILCHELIHIKRKDLTYKFIIFLAKSFHWFNPLVHIMAYLTNIDIELSCDKEVVDFLGESSRIGYTKTLLASIYRGEGNFVFTSNYGGGKKIMKKRIDNIFNTNKLKSARPILVLNLVVIISLGLLVGCRQGQVNGQGLESENIYALKTAYIGDNSKLVALVDSLEISQKFVRDKIEIQSKKEPYGLTIYFKTNLKESQLEDNRKDLIKLFALVDNMDYVRLIGKDGEEYTKTRQNMDSLTLNSNLAQTTRELGRDSKSFIKIDSLDLDREQDDSFDDSVANQMFEDEDMEYWVYEVYYSGRNGKIEPASLDSFTAMAVNIIDVFEEGNIVKIYSHIRKDEVSLDKSGKVENRSGFMVPNLLVFEKMDKDKYVLKEKIEPEEGALYGPSIEKMTKDHPEIKDKMIAGSHDYLNKKIKVKIEKILQNNNILDYDLSEYR